MGLLKSNWLEKHTKQLPAVMVFFYDLDWNDPNWEERKEECSSKLKALRCLCVLAEEAWRRSGRRGEVVGGEVVGGPE